MRLHRILKTDHLRFRTKDTHRFSANAMTKEKHAHTHMHAEGNSTRLRCREDNIPVIFFRNRTSFPPPSVVHTFSVRRHVVVAAMATSCAPVELLQFTRDRESASFTDQKIHSRPTGR